MPFSKPEEVIAHFNRIYETIKPNLGKLFDLTPKTAFEVRRIEAFPEFFMFRRLMPDLTTLFRTKVYSCTKPFRVTITNFLFGRKIKHFRNSLKIYGTTRMTKAGLDMLNLWGKSLGFTPILINILEC